MWPEQGQGYYASARGRIDQQHTGDVCIRLGRIFSFQKGRLSTSLSELIPRPLILYRIFVTEYLLLSEADPLLYGMCASMDAAAPADDF